MENIAACVLMVAVSLPVSYCLARTCLRAVLRFVTGTNKRDVV